MAKLSIDYHPVARLEAIEAFDWYRERSPVAADRFRKELEKGQKNIQNAPDMWGTYLAGTRHYLLTPYPYAIVYRVLEDRIEVVAVAHASREPSYWIDRIPPRDE